MIFFTQHRKRNVCIKAVHLKKSIFSLGMFIFLQNNYKAKKGSNFFNESLLVRVAVCYEIKIANALFPRHT